MKIRCLFILIPLILYGCGDGSSVVLDTNIKETREIKSLSSRYSDEKSLLQKYDLFFELCQVIFKESTQLITEDQIIEWFGPPDTRYDEEGDLRMIYDFGRDASGTFSRSAGFMIEDGKSRMPFIAFVH